MPPCQPQPDGTTQEAESVGSEKPPEDQTVTGQPVEGATDQQPEIVALMEPVCIFSFILYKIERESEVVTVGKNARTWQWDNSSIQ